MDELISAVRKLAEEEFERANGKFPMFASDHEGVGVIEEEICEALDEMSGLAWAFGDLKSAVFSDKGRSEKAPVITQMYTAAIMGACEMVQVASMCEKFTKSWEEKKDVRGNDKKSD